MTQEQTALLQTEDGGVAATKKHCSCRRPLVFLVFLCFFATLYFVNLIETTAVWRDQLWSRYFNTTVARSADSPPYPKSVDWLAYPKPAGTLAYTKSAEPPLTQNSRSPTNPRTATKTTGAETQTSPSPLPLPPPPEYKSPGPYLVEYPYKYSFIVNEATRCQQLKPYLVLVVPVAPQNKADRQIIRDTWGAQRVVLDRKVALFFLLGLGKADPSELREESKQHGDIIQSDFVDCYKNLTIKTMVMLEWLDAHCRDATYAMKIDSDMFLNVPRLLEMLRRTPTTNCLTGLVERAATVHRYASSKWFVPADVFGGTRYPPYVLGLGYVLSLDLAGRLVEASRGVRALYIEDVYLGMCLQRLGLQPTDPPVPGAFHVFPLTYSRCRFSRIIATTLHEYTDRRQLWRDFTQPGPYC